MFTWLNALSFDEFQGVASHEQQIWPVSGGSF